MVLCVLIRAVPIYRSFIGIGADIGIELISSTIVM